MMRCLLIALKLKIIHTNKYALNYKLNQSDIQLYSMIYKALITHQYL